ncbi:MAG: TonB-dependent receptor [Pseudomonadota bacterium]
MRSSKSIRALALSSSAAIAILGLGVSATAQTDEPVTVNTVTDEDDVAVQDRIIVTGSRIATDSALTAPSPVQTVDAEQIISSGRIDVATILRDIPALQGSIPGSFSAQTVADTGDESDLGLSLLDLRDLGIERTLVLQDGRRHVPGTGGQAAVDINAIPASLISRVDVLTGGASSIYGADAVSGVVNFVLRDGRDFDGLEYRLQTGISEEGDAEEVFASIANGFEYDDGRGSAVFALEFQHQTSVISGDRDFAGLDLSTLTPSSEFINGELGLDPATENAFFPNFTLPVSSPFGLINLVDTTTNMTFGGPAPFASSSDTIIDIAGGGFIQGINSIPTVAGTNIPVLQVFDPGVGLRAYNPGLAVDAFGAIGGDGITQEDDTEILLPEQTRFLFNAGTDYELHENITFFAEGKFVFSEATEQAGIPFTDDIPIALDNPFIPAALQAQIQEIIDLGGTPDLTVSRDVLDAAVFPVSDVERTTIRAAGGFRGTIPVLDFNYEASYTWGRTEIEAIDRNVRIEDRYFTAIDAVALGADDIANLDGTINALRGSEDIQISSDTAQIGDIVCRSELDGSIPPSNLEGSPFSVGNPPVDPDNPEEVRAVTFQFGDGQCAPLNIIGLNSISSTIGGANFAFLDLTDSTVVTQQQILLTVSGDSSKLFELPAGPVGFAAGFEWREDTSNFTPDSFRQIEDVVANAAIVNPSPITTDEFPDTIDVIEGFFEVQIPLLADLPFAELLEVSGSARFSNYNTIGNTTAWSINGRYSPHDWITFRGTYNEAVRAPNIGELFGPVTAATIGVPADPCDDDNINNGSVFRVQNCLMFVDEGFNSADFLTAFVFGTTGGNPNLLEEQAETFTVGAVLQPGWIFEGFTFVADYYDIEITDAIDTLTGQEIAEACVDLPSIDNLFCDNVARNPDNGGAISGFTAGQINLASLAVRGVDWSANYSFDVPNYRGWDLGSMRLSAVGTRFLEDTVDGDPTSAEVIAAIADPLEQELAEVGLAIANDELGEFSRPEWIATLGINWDFGKLSLNWQGRFESSQNSIGIVNEDLVDVMIEDGAVVVNPNVGFIDPSQEETGVGFAQDIGFNYDFREEIGFFGGVNNLTDEDPFLGSLTRNVSPRGRFFFVGVRGTF